MPYLEHLFDMVASHFYIEDNGATSTTSPEMRYAYGQVPLKKRPNLVPSK